MNRADVVAVLRGVLQAQRRRFEFAVFLGAVSCSTTPPGTAGEDETAEGILVGEESTSEPSTETTSSSETGVVKLDLPPVPATSTAAGEDGTPQECSADLADTMLQPVFMGFAFDVSGSMGKLDEPWHDPSLKWEPVVAATKAFFSDASSVGFQASLAFFPAEDDRCDAESYAPPDVPMTPLPSRVFAEAIDDVTPEDEDDWRGGTPTLAVTRATLEQLETSLAENPGAKHVFVLVSDGYPQGCDDEEDDIQATVDEVAAVRDHIPTFVIGVQNPPGGPDAVSNLQAVAEAGGSGEAFMVETGSSDATAAAFKAAIEAIRASVTSCTLVIPEPPNGAVFEPDKVNVTFAGTALGYDPACEVAGSWRYDDADAPSSIELCADTCLEVQASATQDLVLEFGCETRPAIP